MLTVRKVKAEPNSSIKSNGTVTYILKSLQTPQSGACGSVPIVGVKTALRPMTHIQSISPVSAGHTCYSVTNIGRSLSLLAIQLIAIRLQLWNTDPYVLPPLVLSLDAGLKCPGTMVGGTQLAHQWFAEWTAAYFQGTTRDLRGHQYANSPVISVTNHGGDVSSSPSSVRGQ